MLVLGIKKGGYVKIAEDITITVVGVGSNSYVKLGIEAPRDLKILRDKLYEAEQKEKQKPATESGDFLWKEKD